MKNFENSKSYFKAGLRNKLVSFFMLLAIAAPAQAEELKSFQNKTRAAICEVCVDPSFLGRRVCKKMQKKPDNRKLSEACNAKTRYKMILFYLEDEREVDRLIQAAIKLVEQRGFFGVLSEIIVSTVERKVDDLNNFFVTKKMEGVDFRTALQVFIEVIKSDAELTDKYPCQNFFDEDGQVNYLVFLKMLIEEPYAKYEEVLREVEKKS